MKITHKTKLNELLQEKPEAAQLLFEAGMGCVGCPAAAMESIEDGCKAHGMNNEKIKELIRKLNEK